MEKANKPAEEKMNMKLDPMKSGTVESYVVKAGDTLSTIAKKIYGEESAYTKIYDANKDQIGKDPDKIKVGMKLVIPPR